MKIKYIEGLNGDRVIVLNDDNIEKETYYIGITASRSREYAKYAHEDVVNAKKYGWKSSYIEKPYIGDLLPENWENLEWFGENVFAGRSLTSDELAAIKEHIKEGNKDD